MSEKLQLIRIYNFNLIPRSILRQLRNNDFLGYTEDDIERLYLFGELVAKDEFNLIYAMCDEEKIIRGVLWLSIDPIFLHLWVTLLVIDKAFQNYKKNIVMVYDFCCKVKEDMKLKKIRAMTGTPRALQRICTGVKPSKLLVVEA